MEILEIICYDSKKKQRETIMKVAGIIAEYNPFHNGHKYQLEQIRQKTKADYIIVAMSGDFLQRGVPACFSKLAATFILQKERQFI